LPSQVFLALSALVWLPYGVFCLSQPAYLDGAAGVVAATATGTTELRAMYGGLQAAIGALCALGALQPRWRGHALVTLAFLAAGLGLARLIGVAIDGGTSSYTIAAIVFEGLSAGIALALLRGSATAAAGG
jgi:hypothetical protein